MRERFVPYLCCPETGEALSLQSFESADGHVIAGLLTTRATWYPIINGIPRLLLRELKTNLLQVHHEFLKMYAVQLPEPIRAEWQQTIAGVPNFDAFLRHQKKTAESFAYEWKYIYKENNYEKQNFFHFLTPYLGEEDLRGRLTLDIGCGSGRFTKWAALSGTEVSFGSDLGETVEVAYTMTKDLPNACIVQADIYDMPFHGVFDIAYSIGVLHHLPKPQEGFSRLPKVLKSGGTMLVWVYNRRGNARALYVYEPLRSVLRHLPKPLLFKLCYFPAVLVQAFNLVTALLQRLKLSGLSKRVPFSYYANFPFNMKLNDAFDVLATPKSNYYYKEQVEQWFTDAKLTSIASFEHPEAGITCKGVESRQVASNVYGGDVELRTSSLVVQEDFEQTRA